MKQNHLKILGVFLLLSAVLAAGCVDRVENIYRQSNIGASPRGAVPTSIQI